MVLQRIVIPLYLHHASQLKHNKKNGRVTQNKMKTGTLKLQAKWKTTFEMMWNNTPKKFRRTIGQVNHIKSLAKLHAEIWI